MSAVIRFLRHNWLLIVLIVTLVVVYAADRQRGSDNNTASVRRSVDTCNRQNTERAYLLLRAREFTKGTHNQPSYTTTISPEVYAILNCEATVAAHGRPIPVSETVTNQYLDLFKQRRAAVLKDGRVSGSVAFITYFGR